jgi:hypothetical protein
MTESTRINGTCMKQYLSRDEHHSRGHALCCASSYLGYCHACACVWQHQPPLPAPPGDPAGIHGQVGVCARDKQEGLQVEGEDRLQMVVMARGGMQRVRSLAASAHQDLCTHHFSFNDMKP